MLLSNGNPTLLAYLDPFTGSLLLQILAASFLTIIVFFKRVKLFVSGLFGIAPRATDPVADISTPETCDDPSEKTP